MCGILGYSGTKPVDPTDIKILLLFSQIRGTHATGIGTVDVVEKANDHPAYFVATRKIPKTNLLIGHTRNPSFNNKKQENNAQPFGFEKFVGVHNGFFRDSYKIKQEYNLDYENSDSYMFFYDMHETSLDDALNRTSETDDFAIAWLDREHNTLNLFRDGKPTFLGQKNGGVYFASEKEFLVAIDCDNIVPTKAQHHYVIKDGEIKSNKKFEYKIKPVKQIGYCSGEVEYEDKDKSTEYSNIAKIGAIYAPKDAYSIFINGKKIYYWLEDKTILNLEVCVSYKTSEKKQYDVSKVEDNRRLGKEYLRILKQVKEILN